MLLWDEMWEQEQINQVLLTKLCDVTLDALGISRIPRKLLNKIFEFLEPPREGNSEVTCGTHGFSPLSECHTCPLWAPGLLGEMIAPDLCCSEETEAGCLGGSAPQHGQAICPAGLQASFMHGQLQRAVQQDLATKNVIYNYAYFHHLLSCKSPHPKYAANVLFAYVGQPQIFCGRT